MPNYIGGSKRTACCYQVCALALRHTLQEITLRRAYVVQPDATLLVIDAMCKTSVAIRVTSSLQCSCGGFRAWQGAAVACVVSTEADSLKRARGGARRQRSSQKARSSNLSKTLDQNSTGVVALIRLKIHLQHPSTHARRSPDIVLHSIGDRFALPTNAQPRISHRPPIWQYNASWFSLRRLSRLGRYTRASMDNSNMI